MLVRISAGIAATFVCVATLLLLFNSPLIAALLFSVFSDGGESPGLPNPIRRNKPVTTPRPGMLLVLLGLLLSVRGETGVGDRADERFKRLLVRCCGGRRRGPVDCGTVPEDSSSSFTSSSSLSPSSP